jgi:ABC-2 type transport system ATP-binding protein
MRVGQCSAGQGATASDPGLQADSASFMIRVDHVYKSYRDVSAVVDLTFAIDVGEVVGFLGPNGAGKSTTLRLLCGLLVADRGQIEVAGQRLPADGQRARAAIGYLPETTPLYRAMRVDRFLRFAGELKGLRGRPLGLAIARVASQCGLEARLGQRIEELSKGFRQRVGLAQALIADPAVLILDEPTSGLDPIEVARLRELIRELGRTKTVLLSTHVLGEVEELCGRALMLYGGRLLADGTLEALTRGTGWLLELSPGPQAPSDLQLERFVRALPGIAAVELLPPAVTASATARPAAGGSAPAVPSRSQRFRLQFSDRALAQKALSQALVRGDVLLEELANERRSLETVFREQAQRALQSTP